MSCQRGNASRSRPQRYQNQTSFKNNLYDNSKKIKLMNSTEVTNVCERCKKIIEWKIKYKKYKVIKAPMKCTKCDKKTVKHSYHNICLLCTKQQGVCSKCGQKKEIVEEKSNKEEIELDAEFKAILKTMSERKRRAFLRYMNQQSTRNKENNSKLYTPELDTDIDKIDSKIRNEDETSDETKREDLLMKLKSLAIMEDDNIDNDIERENDNFDSDIDDLLCDKKCSK